MELVRRAEKLEHLCDLLVVYVRQQMFSDGQVSALWARRRRRPGELRGHLRAGLGNRAQQGARGSRLSQPTARFLVEVRLGPLEPKDRVDGQGEPRPVLPEGRQAPPPFLGEDVVAPRRARLGRRATRS